MLAFLNQIGGMEMLVILIVALLIFGNRLPEVMRSLGKSVNEFKRGMNEVTDQTSAPAVPGRAPVAAPPVVAPPVADTAPPPPEAKAPTPDSPQKSL